MAHDSEFVDDVSDFATQVIERSHETPVLVDFWAPWCGPCRMLGPVLEKLANEYAGAFVLAKVNTDVHQKHAARYNVRGIPDVKLFRDGAVVDGFVGALPEAKVRAFLQKHCPSEAEKLFAEGARLLDDGDADRAGDAFSRALALDESLDGAHFGLARVAMARRDLPAVERHIEAISAHAAERDRAKFLLDAVELIRAAEAAGTEDTVRARAAGDTDDVEAHYAIGGYEIAAGHYRRALEAYLQVAETQRNWREQAARKAMLTVFGILGARHPTSDEFRQKLVFIY